MYGRSGIAFHQKIAIFNLFIVDLSFELFNNCCISNETNEEKPRRIATAQYAVVKKEIVIEQAFTKRRSAYLYGLIVEHQQANIKKVILFYPLTRILLNVRIPACI